MRIITFAVTLMAVIFLSYTFWQGVDAMQSPISPSLASSLSDQELQKLKNLGEKGGCEAVFRVHRYYSDILNDFDKALPWLRIAAKCQNANAKAELVYILLTPIGKGEAAGEIDRLVLELENIDPVQAQAVKEEIKTRRAIKH